MAAVGCAGQTARAQDCALEVKVKKGNPIAYQARGNRCEGIYDQPVANRINLRVAGFHLGMPVFDPQTDEDVRITVTPYEAKWKVRLQVTSTRRRGYFQMDTSAIGDDGGFTWNMEIVGQLDNPLAPFDTAAVACVSDCGRSDRATISPVSISGAGAGGVPPPGPSADMTVLALADVELSSLAVTLRQGARTLFEDLPLGRPPLPPHKPIRIPIRGVDAGEALLSLTAVTRSGQRDYVEAVLLIPGRVR